MSRPPGSAAPADLGHVRRRPARSLLRATVLGGMLLGVAAPAHASLLDRVVPWFTSTVRTRGLAIGWGLHITAQRIALRDAGGTWATFDGVSLRWAPLRLLHGALDVRRLRVQDATLERLPRSAATAGNAGRSSDPLPERSALHALVVRRLTLGPALAGTAVSLRIEGDAVRSAADQVQARLRATEIGGTARYRVQARMMPSGVQARVTAREPPGGPLERLAGLPPPVPGAPAAPTSPAGAPLPPAPGPGAPSVAAPLPAHPTGVPPATGTAAGGAGAPVAAPPAALPGVGGSLTFVATAAGPLAAVATNVSLTLGAAQATAHGTVNLTARRLHLELAATTPAMASRPDVRWSGARLALHVDGSFAAPEASGQLDLADLAAAGAGARALVLHLAGTTAAARLRGRLDGVRLPGGQPGLLGAAPVRFTVRLQRGTATQVVVFAVDHPLVQARGRLDLGVAQRLTARLTVPDLGAFSALTGMTAAGQAQLAVRATRAGGIAQIAVDGTLGLTGGPAPAVALLGPDTRIAAAASYTSAGLSLQRLHIAGRDLTLDLHGVLAPARIDLAWQAALARLGAINPQVAGHLDGAGRVFGPTDALSMTAELSGAVTQGPPPAATAPPSTAGGFTARLILDGLPGRPHGSLDADGEVLGAPLRLGLRTAEAADGAVTLAIRQATWKSAHAEGSLGVPALAGLASRLPTGDLRLTVGRLADFAPLLGSALTGSLQAELRATSDRAILTAAARDVQLPGAAVGDVQVQATLAAPLPRGALQARLILAGVRAGGIDGTVRLDANGALAAPGLRLAASVPRLDGAALALTAAGSADLTARSFTLAALDAHWRGRRLRLLAPTRLALAAGGGITISGLRADLAGGTLAADGQVGAVLALTASLRRLPAGLITSFAPSLPAAGLLSADLRLSGPLARPVGTIRAEGSGLRLLTGPGEALPPARLDASATLTGTTARVTARFAAGGSHLTLAGTAGGPSGLVASAPVALRADGAIDLALANPLLAAGGQQVGGRLAIAARIDGTADAPRLGGRVQLSGGDFRDEVQGVHLRDLAGSFVAIDDGLRIVGLNGRAGAGTIGIDGSVGLLRPGLPVALRLTARNATVLSGGLVTADLDTDLVLSGLLRPEGLAPGRTVPGTAGSGPGGGRTMVAAGVAAALRGTVRVRTATIRVPNQLPASVQIIPVRIAGAPPPAAAPAAGPAAPPIALAVQIVAPQQVFVRGRGLTAELGGTVDLGGTLASMQPHGAFRLIRGSFNLVGQSLNFTSGEIRFAGGSIADPLLHLVASTVSGDTTATLTVGGTASAPQITLTSVPELPQDQILAQLLFHTGAGSLTPLQLASVAAGLAEISGGSSVLPNPLEALRGAFGLDQLGVGSGAGGASTLQAGKYIGRRLYVGAQQGTGGQSTQGKVTYDLTKRVQLRATAGTGETTSAIGASGAASGESVGIRYQMQYRFRSLCRSERERLVQDRHLHPARRQQRGEFPHRLQLPVHQERRRAPAHRAAPGEQLLLVGVAGEAVDRVDGRAHGDFLPEQAHRARAVDDLPRQGADGGEAHEHDAGLRAPEIVLEVVAHPSPRAHAGARHDDRAAGDAVERHRLRGIAHDMQPRHAERVLSLGEQRGELRAVAFRMAAENLGGGDRHWRIEEHLHRRLLAPGGDAGADGVKQLLRPFEREGRHDDVAAAGESVADRGVQLLDRIPVGAVPPVAVGGFHHHDIGRGRRGGRVEQRTPGAAEIAREQDAARRAVLGRFHQDAGRTEDMPGVVEGRAQPVGDRNGFVVAHAAAETV